ncbi:MAG: bifunctional 5,10-methylenetetrahydrofolate dehydrogenase/5,10-methenyltetrahydrofolate cyclohydrolase [Candidatus Binataceae bacterium]|nr:bifunctional 5,10-methylenetetrahydrofolate dehydrogenase/5,10-methenyltetrahydrofolate cyclohydrolase [Candidatus Binataceae bacterium]
MPATAPVESGARIIDGRRIARLVRDEVQREVERLVTERGVRPALDVILVGDDPASRIYVETKQKACEQVGIKSRVHRLDPAISEDELVHFIYRLNRNPEVHGILLQLPLPDRALEKPALAEIDPEKDVDGLSPSSQARLFNGDPGLRPCTPLGVIELIDRSGIDLTGRRAVVVGTGVLVGKPLSLLLLERNATVVLCHEFTSALSAEVGMAEILIAAVGKPGLIRGGWIRSGAVVIDVGINRTPNGIVGDVEFDAARQRAAMITPVPGGVGPMTVAMLVRNTFIATERIVTQVM